MADFILVLVLFLLIFFLLNFIFLREDNYHLK